MSLNGGFKSLLSRWFGEKKKNKEEVDGGKDSDDFIERDTLIKLSLKKGGQVSSQYYRVLGIFNKYYNKWFVEFEKEKKSHSIHRVKRGRPTQTSTNSWYLYFVYNLD